MTCQSRFLVDHIFAAAEISKTSGQGQKPRTEPISPTLLHLCDRGGICHFYNHGDIHRDEGICPTYEATGNRNGVCNVAGYSDRD